MPIDEESTVADSIPPLLSGQQFFVCGASRTAEATAQLLEEFGALVQRGSFDAALLADFVVIHDLVDSGVSDVDAYRARVSSAKTDRWITVTARGLAGGAAHHVADEAILQALGGLVGYTIESETGLHALLPGQPATAATAVVAAIAALHTAASEAPVHIDVSAQEAVLVQGPVLETLHELMECPGAPGSGRFGPPAGVYTCKSGRVLILAVEDHQRFAVIRTVTADKATAQRWEADVDAHSIEIGERVSQWCLERSALDAERELQANRVPASAIASPSDLHHDEQLVGRGFFGADGATRRVPCNVEIRSEEAESSEAPLRVLIAGAVLAIPLAGAVLGALGADVIRVESPDRLDVYRRNGPFIDGKRDIDNGAYFAGANHSMRSVGLDLQEEHERLNKLIHGADVVIENLGPSAARRWGVDRGGLRERSFSGLGISSSGFGSTGPKSEYRAYAYNIHASAGISFDADSGRALDVRNAMADVATAYYVVLLVLAWASGMQRLDAHFDLAMTEIIAARALERGDPELAATVAAVATGSVVISWPRSEESRLLKAFGAADVPALRNQLARRSLDEVADIVERSGGRIAPVLRAPDIVSDDLLTHRGFFVSTRHPVAGSVPLPGVPWVRDGTGRPRNGQIAPFASSEGW